MPSDRIRLHEVKSHIRRIKAGSYPAIVGSGGDYRIEERPWAQMPEGSKLAMLQDAVDWSGITNRDQAHILLSDIDPGKISDRERNRLIGMAQDKAPLKDILEANEPPMTPQEIKELFKEWTHDYAARKQIDQGLAPDDRPRKQERDGGRER